MRGMRENNNAQEVYEKKTDSDTQGREMID